MSTIIQNVLQKTPTNATSTITFPDGCLKPAMWSSQAVDVFPASKQQHCHQGRSNFALAIGATPVAREEIIFVADGDGIVNKFAAILNDTGTSTDVDFVLKKNGASIMSGDLTITHSSSDRAVVEGSLSSTSFVAGDVFSIQLIVNSSTGAQGPYAWADFLENLN